jgi:hypothetical protein
VPFSGREAAAALDALRVLNAAVDDAHHRTGSRHPSRLLDSIAWNAAPAIRILAEHDPGRRERHALYAYRSGLVTVTVQAWDPDKWTPWHDHDCEALAIAVVEGNVREERFEQGRLRRSRWDTGSGFTGDPAAPHRIGGGAGITVHAYAPELAAMNVYAHLTPRLAARRPAASSLHGPVPWLSNPRPG